MKSITQLLGGGLLAFALATSPAMASIPQAAVHWQIAKGNWAAIRAERDRIAEQAGGIDIQKTAETGPIIPGRLPELANEVQEGTKGRAAAVADALALIRENTARN